MRVSNKDKLLGRILPVLFLTGAGLVLVGLGVLSDGDESGSERLLYGLLGLALLALCVTWFPSLRRHLSG